MGMSGIELVFLKRTVTPSELDRDIVKPAGPETAIEMPQPRNDHPHDRHLDVGTCLIEHEEIEACSLGKSNAGSHLPAGVELVELRARAMVDQRISAWRQIGIVAEAQR